MVKLYLIGYNLKNFNYLCTLKGIKLVIMNLSEYVKSMRKMYRLTQVDLSEKSGVGLRFVRELEQGKQTLRMDKVNQVLGMFNSELGVVDIKKSKTNTY